MRYLVAFAIFAVLSAPAILGLGLALAPAPIAAEYWVRQAMVVKAELARRQRDGPKALVVGGSSALFAIDTRALGEEFRAPFVNLATHVHLPLAIHLENALSLAGRGDVVILALEPGYYCPPDENPWFVRNAIAWHPDAWRRLPFADRVEGLWRAGPWLLAELAAARIASVLAPSAIRDRLDALDDAATLRRYAAAKPAAAFGYTLANLDSLGNVRPIEGARPLRQEGFSADTRLTVCAGARAELESFAGRAREAGVTVRFAYSPFMESPGKTAIAISREAAGFEKELSTIAPLLGGRPDATFARGEFFDTGLHLNEQGRARRTAALARAIRADAALTGALVPPAR
jgi:hypothetical protein